MENLIKQQNLKSDSSPLVERTLSGPNVVKNQSAVEPKLEPNNI
jgi:hypothetical protein